MSKLSNSKMYANKQTNKAFSHFHRITWMTMKHGISIVFIRTLPPSTVPGTGTSKSFVECTSSFVLAETPSERPTARHRTVSVVIRCRHLCTDNHKAGDVLQMLLIPGTGGTWYAYTDNTFTPCIDHLATSMISILDEMRKIQRQMWQMIMFNFAPIELQQQLIEFPSKPPDIHYYFIASHIFTSSCPDAKRRRKAMRRVCNNSKSRWRKRKPPSNGVKSALPDCITNGDLIYNDSVS